MATRSIPLPEVTPLTPADEQKFQSWAKAHAIHDVDHPDSHYDMRGYWKDVASTGGNETSINTQDNKLHFPDTYKQHGHPTFSVESKYSRGPSDGGRWVGDVFVPAAERAMTVAEHAVKYGPKAKR